MLIKRFRWLLLLLAATLIAGCDSAKSPQELLAEAKQYRSKGDLPSALIQAKNAVQLAPDLAEAHYLKGAIYLDLGEVRLAEEELRLALEGKQDPRDVIPVLARALLKQDKFQEVLDETVPDRIPSLANSAEIETLRGDAYLGLRRIPAAKTAYESALRYEADYPGALVGLAKLTAADRHPEEGLQLVERALAKAPTNIDALLLKGDLQRVLRRPEAALAAYEEAVRQKPNDLNARLTLASIQIFLSKNDAAKANLAVVLNEVPQSPTANYMQALIEFQKKDFTAAQNLAAQVLKVQPTHVPAVMLAGASEYAAGDYQLAERHLKWLLDLYPNSLYVRKLLVATYSKNGKVLLAIDALQPALKQAPQDADLLALAGEVYAGANEFAKATQYLDMAVKIKPNDVARRVVAGASRVTSGEAEEAVAYMESVVRAAPSQQRARLLLAIAHLRVGAFDKALAHLAQLEKELPKDPEIRNLEGSAYVGKKDFPKARRAFEEAMSLQPAYFPAAANLAQLDVGEKKFLAAKNRFYAVLERDEKNVQAMLAIAELLDRQPGQKKESLEWIERANQTQPNSPPILLILARAKLSEGNLSQALAMARQASTASDAPQVLAEAAQLQVAAGGTKDALETYQKIAKLKPASGEAQLQVAKAQYLAGSNVIAKQTLRKALELKPDLQEALILLAKLEAEGSNRDEALKLVERVKKLAPNAPSGFLLEGDVEMLSKKYANAAKAYERAYAIRKSGFIAAQLHQTYLRLGKPEIGEAVVSKWLEENPSDAKTRQYLADASMKASRLSTAVTQYEWLAQNQPRNQQVLNNLAWAYNESADARAVATAQRAFSLDEANPAAADTYGWILYRNAQYPEAVGMLARAVALAPNSRDIRFHYAQALAKTGDRKNARLELERVLAGSTPFARQLEAKALLDQLKT